MMNEHYYVTGATSSDATVEELLTVSKHRDLLGQLTALQQASQKLEIPYRITECGDIYSSSQTVADPNLAGSYTAALWSLDYMFMCAYQGAQGVNFHSGGPIPSFASFLTGYNYVMGIAPQFYAMKMLNLAKTGNCVQTVVSPGSLNVSGYAMHLDQGGFSVIVSNKDSSHNVQIELELPWGVSQATLIEMTQRSGNATTANVWATSGVTLQGAQIGLNGSYSPAAPYALVPRWAEGHVLCSAVQRCFSPCDDLGASLNSTQERPSTWR